MAKNWPLLIFQLDILSKCLTAGNQCWPRASCGSVLASGSVHRWFVRRSQDKVWRRFLLGEINVFEWKIETSIYSNRDLMFWRKIALPLGRKYNRIYSTIYEDMLVNKLKQYFEYLYIYPLSKLPFYRTKEEKIYDNYVIFPDHYFIVH